jgi:DNA segregation ATPase FtsK/SpoIIIE, S-DNA-T family
LGLIELSLYPFSSLRSEKAGRTNNSEKGGFTMIEWLAFPAALAGAALIPKAKMSDQKKIEQIFKNIGLGIKHKEGLQGLKFMKKHTQDTYTTYLFSVPLGVSYEDVEEALPALKDGLNKEVEIEYKGILKIDVYHKELPTKWNYTLDLVQEGTWEVPIGRNHKGILYHDFDKYQHMLIGGVTRYGKTVLLKEMFHTLLLNNPNDVEFFILDLKGGLEFYKYLSVPQVKCVATDLYEASEALQYLREEIKKSETYFLNKGYSNIVDTPIKKRRFIIVDEGSELAPAFQATPERKKFAQQCQAALSEIARISGGLGMRLIYCTQYPTKESVSMSVKQNMVTRISFVAADKIASRVLLDEDGAEKLPSIPGRALYKIEKTRTVQVPYIDDKVMFKNMEGKRDVIENAGQNRTVIGDNQSPGDGEDQTPSTNS